jgi:very-short-patch-repair endonuclease
MNKIELEQDIKDGLSSRKISIKHNLSRSNVEYWMRKYGLKTQFKRYNKNIISKYDSSEWNEIQNFYDSNHTWEDVQIKFGISNTTLSLAVKSGKFKTRSRSNSIKLHNQIYGAAKHSAATKKKISDRRIAYLTANPDKVPYKINHSSKKSWPEQVFENALIASGIGGWKYAFQNGIYEYDFAFLDKKIDVEIDGGTHKSEKVKRIDKRRDEFSKSQGWTVIRFEASRVKKDVIGCVNDLKQIL